MITNINQLKQTFDQNLEKHVTVRGRVRFVRSFGKLSFVAIQGDESWIQIGFRGIAEDNLPRLWDIIQVSGTTGYTKKGEATVWATEYDLIAKCEGDRPEKYLGIKDTGQALRHRYVDMISDPDLVSRLLTRSRIVSKIRRFLEDRNYFEVETPVLSNAPTGADAKPFITHHNALSRDLYLRIATETSLKKLIVGGIDRVFEIGKIFRNEGVDKTHNPEFTSIELYQAYANLEDMMQLFKDLLVELGLTVDIPVYEYDEIVSKYGEDFDEQLQEICFVTGQPIEQTPLCKVRADGKADRFEVYAGGFEIANAFNEINTYAEQSQRIKPGEDDGLLDALKYGMPPTGGMGIGIDRLVMYIVKTNDIRDVIAFPIV